MERCASYLSCEGIDTQVEVVCGLICVFVCMCLCQDDKLVEIHVKSQKLDIGNNNAK